MSTTLKEVIEAAGYDLTSIDDANWLISQVTQFEDLIEQAENFIEEEQERLEALEAGL